MGNMGSTHCHHWGIHDTDESADGYQQDVRLQPARIDPGLVLTEAGEVLINRSCIGGRTECAVAIVVSRSARSLSRPQTERVERSFDLAVSIAGGARENVHLVPVPHHWRFARADYLTLEEWQQQKSQPEASRTGATIRPDDKGARL